MAVEDDPVAKNFSSTAFGALLSALPDTIGSQSERLDTVLITILRQFNRLHVTSQERAMLTAQLKQKFQYITLNGRDEYIKTFVADYTLSSRNHCPMTRTDQIL